MSIEEIFDAFDEEKKEVKVIPEESPEPSETSESESVPIPEGEDKSKKEVEEETPASSKAEDVDDWFAPAVDEPTKEESAEDKPTVDQPVEEEPVKEKADEESPGEEIEATETPVVEAATEVEDDWFVPAPEEQAPAEIPSKGSEVKGTLISIQASPIVVPAVTAEAMREQMKTFQSIKASLLDKATDIATIQGNPYVKRSGWRKLALVFNISDEIIKAEKEETGDDFEWRIWVRAWAPNGRSVVGIGACSTKERDFSHLEHDVLATAHTRSKNRALSDLIGSGEVSWEELRGMG